MPPLPFATGLNREIGRLRMAARVHLPEVCLIIEDSATLPEPTGDTPGGRSAVLPDHLPDV
jgi:hypothetical protein